MTWRRRCYRATVDDRRCPSGVAVRQCAQRWLAAAAVLIALGGTARAQTEDGAPFWQAPIGCPDAPDVVARIAQRLGAPADAVIRGVRVVVAVDRTGDALQFVARIDLQGRPAATGAAAGRELRSLTSARCDELADAVAVVIARIAAAREPLTADAQPLPRRVERRPESAVAASPWGGGARAQWVSGIGAQPGVGIGGEVAGYVRSGALVAEVAESRWLPSSTLSRLGNSGHIDVSLMVTALRIGWGPEALPLRAWIAAEVGSLRREGVNMQSRWTGAGAGFAVAWPMSPHARLVGTLEVVVPVETAALMMPDGTSAYRPDLATVRTGFGLEVGWR